MPNASGAGDPVVVAAGDIACDPGNANFNGGVGKNGACMQQSTYNLIAGMSPAAAAVLPLGDNQYYCGGYQAFTNSYALSWGKVLSKTYPVVGNHEYLTGPGSDGVGTGCDTSNANAAGYFRYYAGAAKVGTTGEGWYSYDVGSWHLIAINSNCPNKSCGTTGAQYQWLANDLATHKNQCIAAYWHIPLWSSGGRAAGNTQQIVNQLYSAHADVILNGHDHIYERFAPQNSSAVADPTNGIVEFIAGTGGANHTSLATTAANSVDRDDKNFGILKLTLHSASYDFAFVNTSGTVLDSNGSTPIACHNTGSSGTVPPAPTVTPSGSDAADYGTGSTAYYRQGTAGSFTVAATSSGATSMNFPSITGMTGGGTDASAPFSTTYTRTATTTTSGSFSVTATNTTGTSPPSSFTVTPDGSPPLTTASCLPSNCAAASGSQVSVTLTSTDTGAGVSAIYYTTNGTVPSTSSPSVQSGGTVNVPAGQTIQFFGVDRVGNQEGVKSKATTVATGGGSGSIVLQQQKTGSASSAGSLTVPITATTSGDTLVATVAIAAGSTGPLASVIDSSAGTWTKGPVGFLSGVNTRIEMWYRLAAPSVTSVTARFAAGTTKSLAMNVSEWSGVAAASALDVQGSGSGSAATRAVSPMLSATNASDVVIGAVNYSGSATSTAGGTGFTPLTNFDVSSTHGRASYNVTSAAGSFQAIWSLSTASSYGSAALALKAGTTSGSPPSAPSLALQASDGNDFVSGSTVFYGPSAAASGGFTVTATSTGATAVQFPTVFGGDSSNDTSSPYTASYAWTSSATASASYGVTASNSFGTSTATSFTVTPDTTTPSSSAGCNSGADCSGNYSGTVTVKLSANDTGSGPDK
ncbi:MAG TPA: chitobiase/beta-hexosaminidase C-terminal domain-containing protein, partial [Gaiellaceae bacterium]|nr:chitobiase/beta-hexosaminidase C-terminal domain-containing protein [Gaiellaceae bacterium]